MYLRLKAPFAAFRPGDISRVPVAYRPTTAVPSPSTVYGLLLNLAAIEQRTAIDAPITLIRDDLPEMEIAIAVPHGAETTKTERAILSQQLHQYLVGASDKELSKKTHGAKPWIAPIRREILVNLDLLIGVRTEKWLCDRILCGLNGELEEPRYGLPFAGDNNFLIDSIEQFEHLPHQEQETYRWYCPLEGNVYPSRGTCRLTVWIDRADNTKTQTAVFVPSAFSINPPDAAWIKLPLR